MERLRTVLITGALGGIGRALCEEFHGLGWQVLAVDHPKVVDVAGEPENRKYSQLLPLDLAEFAQDSSKRICFRQQVQAMLPEGKLDALIHNAAVQRLGRTEAITQEDWEGTLQVNLSAPLFLTQCLLNELESAAGSVVHIASIHAELTKPSFVTYATSKAAMLGLTRALAVDLGGRIRVNAICPGAISTPMLEAGFAGDPEARKLLDHHHPTRQIGQPAEVARVAVWLTDPRQSFLTGSCVGLDGAIASRLHDPS
jgi:NAD(P)-dependent dehydrogenase (short-subunit alcohol dehydrogenase family)